MTKDYKKNTSCLVHNAIVVLKGSYSHHWHQCHLQIGYQYLATDEKCFNALSDYLNKHFFSVIIYYHLGI